MWGRASVGRLVWAPPARLAAWEVGLRGHGPIVVTVREGWLRRRFTQRWRISIVIALGIGVGASVGAAFAAVVRGEPEEAVVGG